MSAARDVYSLKNKLTITLKQMPWAQGDTSLSLAEGIFFISNLYSLTGPVT